MGKAVEADEIIAAKKKKELTALLENGKEAEFLGQMVIYVINRENRISNGTSVLDCFWDIYFALKEIADQ